MSAVSLNKKLGIKEGMLAYFKNNPEDFLNLISSDNLIIKNRIRKGSFDYIHIFCINFKELESLYHKVKPGLKKDGMLWISWPKGGSSIKTSLKRDPIRNYGLDNGLVDVKIASINEDWSALKFVYRLKDR